MHLKQGDSVSDSIDNAFEWEKWYERGLAWVGMSWDGNVLHGMECGVFSVSPSRRIILHFGYNIEPTANSMKICVKWHKT